MAHIVFRTDSSERIGTGHIMRCLALAEELYEKNCKVTFMCRELPGNLCDLVEKRGYPLYRLPNAAQLSSSKTETFLANEWLTVPVELDAEQTKEILKLQQCVDWLIVDHYGIDEKWEAQMRPYAKKMMVIDDLANRAHDCDVLLDQNFFLNMEDRYKLLVPNSCKLLLGPKYALLRKEFGDARKAQRKRDGQIQQIFIYFGSDPTNETTKTLEAIRLLKQSEILAAEISVDVVVSRTNPNKGQIEQFCNTIPSVKYYCQVDHIARFMANADLAIGAGGTSTWERCYLGLPSIVICIAKNQLEVVSAIDKTGAIRNLGWHEDVSTNQIANVMKHVLNQPEILKNMSIQMLKLMENTEITGVSFVSQTLLEDFIIQKEDCILRPLQMKDLDIVLGWRNSERIRANMYTDHNISPDEHYAWFQRLKNDNTAFCLIFEYKGQPAGVVNFSNIDRHSAKCYWGFYLGVEHLPKGIGAYMGFLGVEYAFNILNIRKLCGEAFAFNIASIKFHKKLGFIQEGRFIQHILKHDSYVDVVSFALFRKDWKQQREELGQLIFFGKKEQNV